MPYHVMIWPKSLEQQKLRELYAINLDEEQLRERFVEPYEWGQPITWQGRTLPAGDFGTITISKTERPQNAQCFREHDVVKGGVEVTNDWIRGAPGHRIASQSNPYSDEGRDRKRVMVVHGRNLAARNAMFTFLRAIGLEPIEWEEAVAETGIGSPHNLDAVRSAMEVGQAVVVILTAEDRAGLLPDFAEHEEDVSLRGQPRQNVILEAGMAMGLNPTRTILVRIGPIRGASDFDGLNVVRITNSGETRAALRKRLLTAECEVSERGSDWMDPDTGGDFDVGAWVEATRRSPDKVPDAQNPYSQAARLQRQQRLKRFLKMFEGIDQPFTPGDLAESIEESGCDEDWAIATLQRLEGEGRVRKDHSGTGWHVASDAG